MFLQIILKNGSVEIFKFQMNSTTGSVETNFSYQNPAKPYSFKKQHLGYTVEYKQGVKGKFIRELFPFWVKYQFNRYVQMKISI